jgi:hypothetical protein
MKIDSLKDLEAVIKVCKKHGVRDITVDGIHMLIEATVDLKSEQAKDKIDTPDAVDETDLLFWSSTPT